jgi:hypothetical protein
VIQLTANRDFQRMKRNVGFQIELQKGAGAYQAACVVAA